MMDEMGTGIDFNYSLLFILCDLGLGCHPAGDE